MSSQSEDDIEVAALRRMRHMVKHVTHSVGQLVISQSITTTAGPSASFIRLLGTEVAAAMQAKLAGTVGG